MKGSEMEKPLNFREKYLIFVKQNKRTVNRQVVITLILVVFTVAYFYKY